MSNVTGRVFSAVLLCSALPAIASASSFGLGAQLNTNGGITVLLPTQTSANMLIEPAFSYYKVRDKQSATGFVSETNDYQGYSVGVGIFAQFAAHDVSRAYAGVRLAVNYATFKSQDDDTGEYLKFTDRGYSIAPTIGIQYLPAERFSLAIEASLAWEKVNQDADSTSSSTIGIETDSEQLTTPVRFIARYAF